jgi:hypothetical protein
VGCGLAEDKVMSTSINLTSSRCGALGKVGIVTTKSPVAFPVNIPLQLQGRVFSFALVVSFQSGKAMFGVLQPMPPKISIISASTGRRDKGW